MAVGSVDRIDRMDEVEDALLVRSMIGVVAVEDLDLALLDLLAFLFGVHLALVAHAHLLLLEGRHAPLADESAHIVRSLCGAGQALERHKRQKTEEGSSARSC